jgi:hypothetical protein
MKEINQDRIYHKVLGRQGRGKTHYITVKEYEDCFDDWGSDGALASVLSEGNKTGDLAGKLPTFDDIYNEMESEREMSDEELGAFINALEEL